MNMNINTKQAFESIEMAQMMAEKMMSSFSSELKTLFKTTVAKKMIEETLKKAAEKAVEEIRKVVQEAVVEEVKEHKVTKPQSAKSLFDKDNREKAKKELVKEGAEKPKAAEVNKRLSEMWKNLDEDEKKPYQKAFEDAKNKYKALHPEEEKKQKKEAVPKKMTAKALFVKETVSDEISEEDAMKMWEDLEDKKKKVYREKAKAEKENAMSEEEKEMAKKKKDPNAPKRRNAYQIFYAEKKADGMKADDIRSAWSNLEEEDKKAYQDMAKTEKEEYEEKIKNFVPSSDSDSDSESKKKSTRPLTARLRFFAEQEENYPAKTKKERTQLMNDAWKEMTADEKKPYEEEAKKELAEWKKANSDSDESGDEKPKKKAVKKVKAVKNDSDSEVTPRLKGKGAKSKAKIEEVFSDSEDDSDLEDI
jgi:hypothetical protein